MFKHNTKLSCKNLSKPNPIKLLWRPNHTKPPVKSLWQPNLINNSVTMMSYFSEKLFKNGMPSGRIMAAPSWPEVQSRLLWCNPSGWGPADWSSHYFFLRISSFFTTGFKRNTHPHPMIYTTGQKVELFRLQRKTENIRSKVNLGNIDLVSVTHLAGKYVHKVALHRSHDK